MKKNKVVFLSVIVLLFICIIEKQAIAQSKNEKAQVWFEVGHLENDVARKIHAYDMATKEDSTFVNAYYYLGMTYKAGKKYSKAGENLLKAFRLGANGADNNIRYKTIRELADIFNRLKNYKEYEKALRACIPYALTDSQKREHAIALSRFLNKQNRKEEAIAILKDLQGKIHESSSHSLLSMTEMLELITKSEKAIANGDVGAAKDFLEKLIALSPNQENVKIKMIKLDSLIHLKEIDTDNNNSYGQAIRSGAEGNLDQAIFLLEKILRNSREYKDTKFMLEQFRQAREKRKEAKEQEEQNSEPDKTSKTDGEQAEIDTTRVAQLLYGTRLPLQTDDDIIKAYLHKKRNSPSETISQRQHKNKNRLKKANTDLYAFAASNNDKDGGASGFFKKNGELLIYFVGIVAIVISSTMIVIFLIPLPLARFFLSYKKYDFAIKLLRIALRRTPENTEVYQTLVNLYLYSERNDREVVEFFKTILKDDIPVDNVDKIYFYVQNYYTDHGEMDSVLEKIKKKGVNANA